MIPRLVTPAQAAERVAERLVRSWPELVCDELTSGRTRRLEVPVAPGVQREGDVVRVGVGAVHTWAEAWRDLAADDGLWTLRVRTVTVQRVPRDLPATLVLDGVVGALAFLGRTGVDAPDREVRRGRAIATTLLEYGARLTPATLRAVQRLDDADVEVLTGVLSWLGDHADVSGWTARQLPVPGTHSKWLEQHGTLLRELTDRDVRLEVRPRLAVVHLTYVDPDYLATSGRRHDAWTTGDTHELAYPPTTVLVVENRDCRLWFPPVPGTVVVEGGGKAAAALLGDVPWIRQAGTVAYWGDIDAAGFAILDRFRAVMADGSDGPDRSDGSDGGPRRSTVHSLLMDAPALSRYEHLGGDRDRRGRPIPPSSTVLRHLTEEETAAYYAVATQGPVAVRRVEQERIPVEDAAAALVDLLDLPDLPGRSTADGRTTQRTGRPVHGRSDARRHATQNSLPSGSSITTWLNPDP